MVITIDGPAGSGKSTAARELARALGVAYLDTGAMYRAVTLAALRSGTNLSDEQALTALARRIDLRLRDAPDGLRVLLDGQDATAQIRSAEVSDNSHFVARAQGVRAVMVDMQRRIGRDLQAASGGLVSEGRDQGSVVFPDAEFKFYLDADPEVRARRRFQEMQADGQTVTFQQVLQGILDRDGRDSKRAVAPLLMPEGAVRIDTTGMTVQEMTADLLRRVRGGR